MAKTIVFVIPAVLLFMYGVCEALECYHCYSGVTPNVKDSSFVRCNEANLPASNTWTCPFPNDRCVYRVVDVEFSKERQIWRSCSKGAVDPCDPNSLPMGVKHIKCTHCGTDKCNLQEGVVEQQNNTFTFNVNANVNLYIRQ